LLKFWNYLSVLAENKERFLAKTAVAPLAGAWIEIDNGKWNRSWMCFLYKIEGYEGCYCSECVKKIMEDNQNE